MNSKVSIRFLDQTTPPHIGTLILLAGVSALNTSIFLPSLVAMANWFGTDYAVMQLSISAYLLTTAALQVLIGPISDKYGRRTVTLWSLGIFVAATIGALLAPTIELFLFFRMAQAVVAGGIVLSRAIVRDLYPPNKSASMIGYVTMGMALAPMLGPMIGGALEQWFEWQATFVFLLACGIIAFVLCWQDLGETIQAGGLSFRQQVRTYPELFGSTRFWCYVASAALGSGAFFSLLGGGAIVAQNVFGLSPFQTGLALGSPALGYAVGNGIAGRFSERTGINKMALIGTIVSTVGMGLSLGFGLAGLNSPLSVFGFCTALGLGNGMLLPNTTAGSLSVRPHLAGTASGLGAAIMIGGGAALSQLAGVILTPGGGALPLQILMFVTAACAIPPILYVMWRDLRQV